MGERSFCASTYHLPPEASLPDLQPICLGAKKKKKKKVFDNSLSTIGGIMSRDRDVELGEIEDVEAGQSTAAALQKIWDSYRTGEYRVGNKLE